MVRNPARWWARSGDSPCVRASAPPSIPTPRNRRGRIFLSGPAFHLYPAAQLGILFSLSMMKKKHQGHFARVRNYSVICIFFKHWCQNGISSQVEEKVLTMTYQNKMGNTNNFEGIHNSLFSTFLLQHLFSIICKYIMKLIK